MTVRPSAVSAVLLLSVLGVSTAGPLVRLSDAHPVAIAAWRLAFSLAIIAVPLGVTGTWRRWRSLDATSLLLAAIGGVMLAIHFWTWNASINLTTIAASTVLVNTQPLIVAIISAAWLREAPTRTQWIGITIAMFGAAVIFLPDFLASEGAAGGSTSAGNFLALAGAMGAAIYYVVGRRLRSMLDIWSYAALVYSICLVTLIGIALTLGVSLGPYPAREYGIFALLALGPMLLGHTALNWALGHIRAYQVNVVLLGEPLGATLIAAFLPGIRERPTLLTLVGGAIIITGIVLAERRRRT